MFDGVHVVVPLWPWCREAVLHLTGWRHQGFYGSSSQRARAALSIPDVLARVQKVRGLLLAREYLWYRYGTCARPAFGGVNVGYACMHSSTCAEFAANCVQQ